MESLNGYLTFWGLYLAFGFLGYWCWVKMAFWVESRGLFYHLYSAVGAVVIFTPVPVAVDSAFYSPGAVVIGFAAISGSFSDVGYLALWYGVASALAFGITLIMAIAGLLPVKTTAEADAAPAVKPEKDVNPFR